MITNYDNIKNIVNDREKLLDWLLEENIQYKNLGICDTNKCPHLDVCNENPRCILEPREEIDIWLDMPYKENHEN